MRNLINLFFIYIFFKNFYINLIKNNAFMKKFPVQLVQVDGFKQLLQLVIKLLQLVHDPEYPKKPY